MHTDAWQDQPKNPHIWPSKPNILYQCQPLLPEGATHGTLGIEAQAHSTDVREHQMKRLFPSLPDNARLGDVYQAFPEKLAPLCAYESLVMRGESDLSVADRELIAAYVSGLNACAYCHGAHIVFAKAYGIEVETIEALMEDRDSAPVRDSLKPILAYVEKLTVSPSRMTEADARAVYAAGWSESALFDAIQVCGVFNLVNRFIEGTGVQSPGTDPREADEETLGRCRSDTFYTDFGRQNGLDV